MHKLLRPSYTTLPTLSISCVLIQQRTFILEHHQFPPSQMQVSRLEPRERKERTLEAMFPKFSLYLMTRMHTALTLKYRNKEVMSV